MRNKYPDDCCICAKHVPANKGHFEGGNGRNNKKWRVRCDDCVGKGAPHKQKCATCGKKLLPGEGHYNKTKQDEGGGCYSEIWTAYCDKCKKDNEGK